MASLFSPAGLTEMLFVVAEVTVPCVVSAAVIVYGEPAVDVIWRPLKFATPLTAASEVVPEAKLPDDRVSPTVSVDPAFPVVIVLPYWSSTVTPTETVPPAVMDPAGWVVVTSLFSLAGVTVKELVVACVTVPRVESIATIV